MINQQLSRLTIIIPTYNRQAYALRNLKYWSGIGPTVHVLDGSASPIDYSLFSDLRGNVHYHHLPISFYKRFEKALELIETDYVVLNSDDEFFLPEALRCCIDFLDAEKDMVSCGGRCLGFSIKDKKVIGWPQYLQQAGYTIDSDDPSERMLYHMYPYTPSTIYSVLKSDVWKKAVSMIVTKEFPVYAMGEIQFELTVSFLGKSKVLQNLMWLRSKENAQLTGTSISLNPDNLISNWWCNSHALNQRNEFLDIMSSGLAFSPAGVFEVKEALRSAIDVYVNANGKSKKNSIDKIVSSIKKLIPLEIKQVIRMALLRNQDSTSSYQDSTSSLNAISLMDAAKAMAATGVAIEYQELANIERIVNEFNEN